MRCGDGEVMEPHNPYEPPGKGGRASGVALSVSDWRRGIKVFAGWTLVSAILSGTVNAMRAAHALRGFGAEERAVGIIAVGALRLEGVRVAVSAAAMALVVAFHRRSEPAAPAPTTGQLWPMMLVLPVTAVVAACVIVGAALAVASLAFGVPCHASWASAVRFVCVEDPLVGICAAALSAAILGVAVPRGIRWMTANPRGLLVKMAVALLAAMVLNTVVGIAVEALSLGEGS